MSNIKNTKQSLIDLIRASFYSTIGVTLLVLMVASNFSFKADAAQLQSRSLTVSSSALGNVSTDQLGNAVAAGSGGNGQKTEETFTFNVATTANIGSMLFEICTTPIPGTTCTSPTGFTAANVTSIASQSGISSFTLDTSTVLTGSPYNCTGTSPGRTNCIAITKASPSSVTSGATVTVAFGGTSGSYITNPTTTGTFYARIVTYTDSAYTTQDDYGTVASSTATEVNVNANVEETLGFSVGSSVTAPTSACTPFSDSGDVSLGDSNDVLYTSSTYFNHSYFRIYTNDLHGAVIDYSGNTLHNATNTATITAMSSAGTSSAIGTSQFGIAIDSYDTESGSGYSFTSLTPTSPYNAGDGGGSGQSGNNSSLSGTYAFNTGSTTTPVSIASSTGPITCDTGSVIYIANISTITPPAVYGTTITYIAIPTY